MLFSTVDYTHTVTKGQIRKWKIQTPKQFFSSPKGIFCYDTVAAFGKPQCCCVWKWLADTVKLSRSEWLPLCRRLCGPGQDWGLQDYESYFTPHLPLCCFFLCVNVKHILRQFCCLKMHLWEPDLKNTVNRVQIPVRWHVACCLRAVNSFGHTKRDLSLLNKCKQCLENLWLHSWRNKLSHPMN